MFKSKSGESDVQLTSLYCEPIVVGAPPYCISRELVAVAGILGCSGCIYFVNTPCWNPNFPKELFYIMATAQPRDRETRVGSTLKCAPVKLYVAAEGPFDPKKLNLTRGGDFLRLVGSHFMECTVVIEAVPIRPKKKKLDVKQTNWKQCRDFASLAPVCLLVFF